MTCQSNELDCFSKLPANSIPDVPSQNMACSSCIHILSNEPVLNLSAMNIFFSFRWSNACVNLGCMSQLYLWQILSDANSFYSQTEIRVWIYLAPSWGTHASHSMLVFSFLCQSVVMPVPELMCGLETK